MQIFFFIYFYYIYIYIYFGPLVLPFGPHERLFMAAPAAGLGRSYCVKAVAFLGWAAHALSLTARAGSFFLERNWVARAPN